MKTRLPLKSLVMLVALTVIPLGGLMAEEQLDVNALQNARMLPGANYAATHEPPILMRSKHFDYDHEIRVSLPATYGVQPEKSFPVLWLTDGSMAHDLTAGIADMLTLGNLAPELIIVSVGAPNNTGMAGFGRRSIEFAPPGDRYLYDGPGAEYMYAGSKAAGIDLDATPQMADEFLSFIIDEVRPALAKKYRFNGDHGLGGHSGGGMFTGYALFARPLAFNKYLIGSPSINASDRLVFRMEAEYAEKNEDFPVSVFLAAGEGEITNTLMAAWEIVSAPILLAERLQIRQYPSLKLSAKIYPGRNHIDVLPIILMDGIQKLWGPDVPGGPNLIAR